MSLRLAAGYNLLVARVVTQSVQQVAGLGMAHMSGAGTRGRLHMRPQRRHQAG